MSDTRIKIDIAQGIIEAEGSESFVRSIYDDFKDKLQTSNIAPYKQTIKARSQKKESKKDTTEKKTKTTSTRKPPQIVKDLNLSGENDKPSLRDFYSQYNAISYFEKNLLFVYYLEHRLEFSPITTDHVFTCYRSIKVKAPKVLYQSLYDTTHHKGWLDTSSLDNIKVTVAGINYFEHDMAKAKEK